MRISVVVPVYNEETYIGACLDALMKQVVLPDEIIVVDNNSTDRTVEIAKRYPIKLVKEKQQGMTPARNKGFNEAKYEIISRTDADTVVSPTWIKRIKKNFEDEELVGVSGPGKFYDLPNFVQNSHLKTKPTWFKLIKIYNRVVKKVIKHDCLYGPNYAIRRSGWLKIKNEVCLNDKQVHEDLDLAIHLSPYGKIKFDNSLIVNTSVRRWKKPDAYIEYLYRGLKSIQKHKNVREEPISKQFFKKIISKAFMLDQQ